MWVLYNEHLTPAKWREQCTPAILLYNGCLETHFHICKGSSFYRPSPAGDSVCIYIYTYTYAYAYTYTYTYTLFVIMCATILMCAYHCISSIGCVLMCSNEFIAPLRTTDLICCRILSQKPLVWYWIYSPLLGVH